MRFFKSTRKASFVARPNRFVLVCDLDGKTVRAYLPNPGRLQELLFPGVEVWLEESDDPNRKMAYTAVAVVDWRGEPVVLHTHVMNDVAQHLLERGLVPGLEGARIVGREVTRGRSRFDFLLEEGKREILLEVKSCTLFSRRVAMFPDAVTARGKKHVEELAQLSGERTRGAVLFLVNSLRPEIFLPDFHTDLAFSRTLLGVRKKSKIIPRAIGWTRRLALRKKVRLLNIPWDRVERDAHDSGSYLVVLRLRRARTIEVGRLGRIRFEPGFYTYIGSARRSLSKRIERHRRLRKKMHWHIDYLRAVAEWHAALPVLSADDLECSIASALRETAQGVTRAFGSSDCDCDSHLVWSAKDPLQTRAFQELLQSFRMERLTSC